MFLINCKTNLILTWSPNDGIISNAIPNQGTTFPITEKKPCILVVTLSTQDIVKLLDKLKLGFKRAIMWNKYQSNTLIQAPKQYLDYLIDPNFQGAHTIDIFLQLY